MRPVQCLSQPESAPVDLTSPADSVPVPSHASQQVVDHVLVRFVRLLEAAYHGEGRSSYALQNMRPGCLPNEHIDVLMLTTSHDDGFVR